jgi:hypothetical protein
MRDDGLAYVLDENRFSVSTDTAWDMYSTGQNAVTGADVARAYGLLAHYINRDRLALIIEAGRIGPGCWLTPTAYAACLTPYNLGLDSPRNMCLLIDVSEHSRLWGQENAGHQDIDQTFGEGVELSSTPLMLFRLTLFDI